MSGDQFLGKRYKLFSSENFDDFMKALGASDTSNVRMSSEILTGILGKRYKLQSSDKFDEYMKTLGVGLMTRKMGSSVSPVVELTENNGTYTLKTTSPFKNTEIKFKLGEEFDEETADGRKVKSVCTLEGNKLVQVQKGDKDTTIEREFSPTEMKAIMKADDIVCTRVYKVQE
ncbi:PREDICTED: probable fatty acid-binding protein isoform X2 [Dinoponera quadriceps]|uniref:Fatty acid-binding protein, muscle n=1 Tax=Dinoponera quadriceps TaxID=609295 RepID=A0A6P3X9J5_DINQU|nr:PREDICTED: probable fatty acid-binding protein isoform X2 [Dinoponera quadriceps]